MKRPRKYRRGFADPKLSFKYTKARKHRCWVLTNHTAGAKEKLFKHRCKRHISGPL